MAGVERFELPTVGFGDRCSTNWNYTPATEVNYTDAILKVKSYLQKKQLFERFLRVSTMFTPKTLPTAPYRRLFIGFGSREL